MRALGFMVVTAALWLAGLAAPALAAQQIGPGPHVQIRLIAESDTPAPSGEVTLAFVSTPDPGWHAYWQNPGDAGLPTRASWTLPASVSAGAIEYPVPTRLSIAGLMNYVYEGPYAPLVKLKVGPAAPGTKLPVKVHLDYLVCTDAVCVPEKADLETMLTVGGGAVTPERRADFDRWRKALPRPLGSVAVYQRSGDTLRIAVPFPASAAIGDAYFFPATLDMVDYAAPQKVTREGDRLSIETRAKGSATGGPIDGVLSTTAGQGLALHAVPGTLTAGTPPAPAQGLWLTTLIAFAGAVLGGVILNVMPCVFPILSLKALSLAKANDGAGDARGDALAYAAGVILVCMALGGILLALRAGGASLGWGFQLQDPRMILLLLLLVMGIALNLAGLFELSVPAFVNRAGAGGSFMTGALAAFIATPCSGPFMGVALGASLVLPWPAALAVFAGLGLGIALPFLLIGFVPALRRRLPRPGAWMETFRHLLSIPMFLTGIALAWVLGRQIGVNGMALALLVVLGLAIVLWAGGRRQARGSGFGVAAWLAILAIAVAGVWLVGHARAVRQSAPSNAEAFSEKRLTELVAQHRPVFAYFTADWCLTCKVNEKGVIETEAVSKALADGKVTVLVGDWTNGDPALGRFIEQHNRAGVPLYLWYKPGMPEPEVLPQILTQAMIEARASSS